MFTRISPKGGKYIFKDKTMIVIYLNNYKYPESTNKNTNLQRKCSYIFIPFDRGRREEGLAGLRSGGRAKNERDEVIC